MKKTTKKSASTISQKMAVKHLEIKPAKGRTVRGGVTALASGKVQVHDIPVTKTLDNS